MEETLKGYLSWAIPQGGHLAELINADPQYFQSAKISNPIKGIILNDPFGLDMHEYLEKADKDKSYLDFLRTFSKEPATWKMGSPLNYVSNIMNPHLIVYGAKTYPAIQIQSERLHSMLLKKEVPVSMSVIKNKKHVGMITQMIFPWNNLYDKVVRFMKSN